MSGVTWLTRKIHVSINGDIQTGYEPFMIRYIVAVYAPLDGVWNTEGQWVSGQYVDYADSINDWLPEEPWIGYDYPPGNDGLVYWSFDLPRNIYEEGYPGSPTHTYVLKFDDNGQPGLITYFDHDQDEILCVADASMFRVEGMA